MSTADVIAMLGVILGVLLAYSLGRIVEHRQAPKGPAPVEPKAPPTTVASILLVKRPAPEPPAPTTADLGAVDNEVRHYLAEMSRLQKDDPQKHAAMTPTQVLEALALARKKPSPPDGGAS